MGRMEGELDPLGVKAGGDEARWWCGFCGGGFNMSSATGPDGAGELSLTGDRAATGVVGTVPYAEVRADWLGVVSTVGKATGLLIGDLGVDGLVLAGYEPK
jgi:hypothetical protein